MAIKIQGSTIINDSKEIQDNTGVFTDSSNSGFRPKSSSGGSYFQRWNGSGWETILYGANTGVNCYRDLTVVSPYKFVGNGSGLTNLPTPAFPYNYYYDATNTAVRANGTTFIQNGAGNDTFATFNSGGISLTRDTSVSGNITSTGRLNSSTHYSDANNTALRAPGGIYLQNSNGSTTHLYADSSQVQIYRDLYLNSVPEGAVTAEPNLKLSSGNRIKRLTSTRRIKENIQYSDFEDVCEKIYDLKTAYFSFKNDETSKIDMGLIAEDVAEFFPELAIIDYYEDQYEDVLNTEMGFLEKKLKKDAVKTPTAVAYDRISLIMIGTLKKLRQRVIDLEEEVQTLKASSQTP
jgi:hypothetical protein